MTVVLGVLLTTAVSACALVPGRRAPAPRVLIAASGVLIATATCAGAARHTPTLRPVADDAWTAVVALLPAVVFHLLLRTGGGPHERSPARRRLAVSGYAIGVVTAGAAAFGSARTPALLVLLAAAIMVGAGACLLRLTGAEGAERIVLVWILAGLGTALCIGACGLSLSVLIGWPGDVTALGLTSALCLPAGVWAAGHVLRPDRIDRALVVLAASMALILIVMGTSFGEVFVLGHPFTTHERSLLPLSILFLAAGALVFTPLRGRISRWLLPHALGERPTLGNLTSGFLAGLSRAVPLDETLLTLVEAIREGLSLTAVEIWTGGDGHLVRQISDPARTTRRVTLPAATAAALVSARVSGDSHLQVWFPELRRRRGDVRLTIGAIAHRDRLLGVLVLERPASAEIFTEEEAAFVAELSSHLARVLHNLELDVALESSHDELRRAADELRASRARIVAASDSARVRIERDLHDGAQQRLLSLSMRLAATRAQVTQPVGDELDAMAAELREATHDLRALARGIYPPLLTEAGLGPALAAAARTAPIAAQTEIDVDDRHPREVEAAVYFCCLEALQNATKHAGQDATVTIQVSQRTDELQFTVQDNGVGFAHDTGPTGLGLDSIRDRAGAIGGHVEIRSSVGGGTTVSGAVPLRGSDPAAAPAAGSDGAISP